MDGENKGLEGENQGNEGGNNGNEGGDKGADLATQVATLTALVSSLTAAAEASKAAAEEARKAALSDAERLAEDRKAVDAEHSKLAETQRNLALDRLGVSPKVRALAPAVDAATAEGVATLEKWAKENPEFLVKQAGSGDSIVDKLLASKSAGALVDVLSGKKSSPYMSVEGYRKLLGG